MSEVRASGGCLCGAVRYTVSGPLRDVLVCHCADCRRWHGHVCAATACRREDLAIEDGGALAWYAPPGSDASGRRGFCARCGSSLFWEAPDRPTVSIAAGTLDEPTGLVTIGHAYTAGAGDYYAIPDDGLPRHARSSLRAVGAP